MLEFWKTSGLSLHFSESALDSATVKRQLGSLEWWKYSGLKLRIGNVLDFASMEGSTGKPLFCPPPKLAANIGLIPLASFFLVCLDWWSTSGLECKYSKAALFHLSQTGNVELLDWWKNSRHPLLYTGEVLHAATRHGQTGVLSWWRDSGLDIEYRFFDIEEALEDSVNGKEEAQKWWEAEGYDTGLSTNDWTKIRFFGRKEGELVDTGRYY